MESSFDVLFILKAFFCASFPTLFSAHSLSFVMF